MPTSSSTNCPTPLDFYFSIVDTQQHSTDCQCQEVDDWQET